MYTFLYTPLLYIQKDRTQLIVKFTKFTKADIFGNYGEKTIADSLAEIIPGAMYINKK